jgi:lysophospholipase L1-like esterase
MGRAATRLLIYAGVLAVGVGTASVALAGPPKLRPGKRVFLVGDSLAVGLSRPLSALAKDNNVAFESMAIQGTRLDQWANNETLFAAIQKFKPDLILVSLGTNDEYLNLDGGTKQAPHLKALLGRLRMFAPVAWIGPPKLPKQGSNGVVPLIMKSVPSSHYFPSHELDISRAPDKLHPTTGGYAGWAGKIWEWIT